LVGDNYVKSAIDLLRTKALRILREDEATAFIISLAGREGRTATARNRARIAQASEQELRRYIDQAQTHINERRSQFGIKAKPSELIAFLEASESAPPNQVYRPRIAEVRTFFDNYGKVWPDSTLLPAHARIIFDAHGNGPDGEPIREVYILEASIYEDMAALWNLLQERLSKTHFELTPSEQKIQTMLQRTTIVAAISFLEAYLNGLAFDHLAQHIDHITNKEKSDLSEWNLDMNRPQYLSIRDKILRYQCIILAVGHAPLQPTNCPELESLLNTADTIRNSLAHPAPHFNPRTGNPDKEFAIYQISIETVKETVDSSIEVVKRLEELIYGNPDRIPWLIGRTLDGLFPPEAFE